MLLYEHKTLLKSCWRKMTTQSSARICSKASSTLNHPRPLAFIMVCSSPHQLIFVLEISIIKIQILHNTSDNGHSFDQCILYGHDISLVLVELLLCACIDALTFNFTLSLIVTFLFILVGVIHYHLCCIVASLATLHSHLFCIHSLIIQLTYVTTLNRW